MVLATVTSPITILAINSLTFTTILFHLNKKPLLRGGTFAGTGHKNVSISDDFTRGEFVKSA